jgi:hypothetical protein
MKKFSLFLILLASMCFTFACYASPVPYSASTVKIPDQLEFLTDYIQTGHYMSKTLTGTYRTTTVGGVTTSTPVFTYANKTGYVQGTNWRSMELASAFVEYPTPPVITTSGNTITVNDEQYTLNGGTLTRFFVGTPKFIPCMLNVSGVLKGLTVQQVQDYFGSSVEIFTITIVLPDGSTSSQYTWNEVDKSAKVNDRCTLWAWVSPERILADAKLLNKYDKKGKYMVGPYPSLKLTSTIDDMPPVTITTMYTRPVDNQVSSVFVYLTLNGSTLTNNTFVNKQMYYDVPGVMKNPAGYAFSPTYVITLRNEPSVPYSVNIMGSQVGKGNSNGWMQLKTFDSIQVLELADKTKDGYIDVANQIIYVNPTKKCVIEVEYGQYKMGDPFGKTYAWSGAINYQTHNWSKFYYYA